MAGLMLLSLNGMSGLGHRELHSYASRRLLPEWMCRNLFDSLILMGIWLCPILGIKNNAIVNSLEPVSCSICG